jgi:AraC family transcriptional regulator, ethanolamine operon transcriptional activator
VTARSRAADNGRVANPNLGSGAAAGGSAATRTVAAKRSRTERTSYRDFEELEHSGVPRDFEITLIGPERGVWTRTSAILDRSALQIGSECGANVGHGRIPEHMTVFHVALSGLPPICGGARPGRTWITVEGPGSEHIEAVRGPSRWATFAVAPEVLDEACARLRTDEPLYEPGRSRIVRASAKAVQGLRAVFLEAERRILESPADFEDAAFRARLRRDLVDGLAGAVHAGTPVRPTAGTAAPEHQRILIACMRHLGATREHSVTIEELCGAVSCSRRTLTRVFREAFDISPARYLRLRRLNQVRSWLRRADPAPNVTGAATRFGFYELGRFAGDYRRLFGELPSETLRLRLVR